MKPLLSLCMVLLFCTTAMLPLAAQSALEKARKDALERHQSINENFKLHSPTENTDITKPFRVAGYGLPGATVEINIRPVSKGGDSGPVFVAGGVNTREPQNFTTTVDANGSWVLPKAVTVSFKKNATERRVHVIAGQYKGALKMKPPVVLEIKLDNTFKVVGGGIIKTDHIKITSHVDGDKANGIIQIKGTGKPGTVFLLSLYGYAWVVEKSWGLVGGKAYHERRFYKNHKVTVDNKGNWEIPAFQQYGALEWLRNAYLVYGWTIETGPMSPNDKTFPQQSRNYYRLVVDESYRNNLMRESMRDR